MNGTILNFLIFLCTRFMGLLRGISYMTPNDCYNGKANEILGNRNKIIQEFNENNKSRFRTAKPYAMPDAVQMMSFSVKRKQVEQSTKNAEYAAGSKAKVA